MMYAENWQSCVENYCCEGSRCRCPDNSAFCTCIPRQQLNKFYYIYEKKIINSLIFFKKVYYNKILIVFLIY